MAQETEKGVTFRKRQVEVARQHIQDLKHISRKIAEAILNAFLSSQITEGTRRTDIAELIVRAQLSAAEQNRPKAVDFGVQRARKALMDAYQEIQNS